MKTYNDFDTLPNVKRISADEFAKSMLFTYKPQQTFTGSLEVDPKEREHSWSEGGKYFDHVLAFRMHDGTGYAIRNRYWKGEVEYYRFGECFHDNMSRRTIGNCLNEYTCKDCGYKTVIDSSD